MPAVDEFLAPSLPTPQPAGGCDEIFFPLGCVVFAPSSPHIVHRSTSSQIYRYILLRGLTPTLALPFESYCIFSSAPLIGISCNTAGL